MKTLLGILLAAAAAMAAPIIMHDGTNVTGVLRSANTPDFVNRADALIVLATNDWRAGVTNYLAEIPEGWAEKRWKIAGGTNLTVGTNEFSAVLLREWTQEELDAEAAAQASAAAKADTFSAKEVLQSVGSAEAIALRAVLEVLIDEVNTLRAHVDAARTNLTEFRNLPLLPARTLGQAKSAIETKIEER